MRSLKLLLLFACRSVGLYRLARWHTRNRLKILCYHGFQLTDEAQFRPKLFISGERFERRLRAIRALGLQVLPLDEAVARLYSRSLPTNAVAITIDDGFHSVGTVAVPKLQQHRYPATVYLTTYYVENATPIFRLVVQYMFWKSKKGLLILEDVRWAETGTVDLANAQQADQAMWACIQHGEMHCSEVQRVELCRQLGQLLETPYDDIVRARILHLMTPDEVRALVGAQVDVQLHTHRHRFPDDDREQAMQEITDNRRAIGRWVEGDRRHFCYPSGLFEQRQFEWLDEMGVKSSTTCIPGLNSETTPRHGLHRFLDGENVHQLEFEAALSGFTDLLRGVVRGGGLR